MLPDIAQNLPPLPRVSLKTKKPMKPITYVWWWCPCGYRHAAPLQARGTIGPGTCPFCGGKRK